VGSAGKGVLTVSRQAVVDDALLLSTTYYHHVLACE
jgi:hypothetical protein